MAREFDLLGDPVPENFGKPGANGHVPTAEKLNKVRLLVVAKWTAKQIADELGISVPTLNKHYFRNASIKRSRAIAIAEAQGRVMLQLDLAASEGSVSAMKELKKQFERAELELYGKELTDPKKAMPIGKKELRKRAAASPDPEWGFLPGATDKSEMH